MADIGSKNKKRIHRALVIRDGKICFYCRKDLVFAYELPESCPQPDTDERPIATLDHIQPRAEGGRNGIANLVLACRPCHRERHE